MKHLGIRIGLAAVSTAGILSAAAAETTITMSRYYGSCEADYADNTDLSKARGECGIITTLVNKFNAENTGGHVVEEQVVEFNNYYEQISARLAAGDPANVGAMSLAQLADYARRGLVEPITQDLKAVGIGVDEMAMPTRVVEQGGEVYALPYDVAGWLWHYNLGLLEEGGVIEEGGEAPVPQSREELLEMAETFKQNTGKPLLVVASDSVTMNGRLFYQLVHSQGARIMQEGDLETITFDQPEVRESLDLLKTMADMGYMTTALDYSAAGSAFLSGDGAIFINGTWVIDSYLENAEQPDSVLADGYDIRMFPTIFDSPSNWIDSNIWVVFRDGTEDEGEEAAVRAFLKFLWEHNDVWAKTGHLPAKTDVYDQESFKDLRLRDRILDIEKIGVPSLPYGAKQVYGIQNMIGEELAAMLQSGKSIDDVVSDMQVRADRLLARAR